MEHGKNPLAVRRWSAVRDASAVATSRLRRSLAFWATTRRYLRIPRIPSTVAVMAIANGGRSCDIKGVSSPQSSIAAASVGIWAVPWNCTSLRFRVWYPKWKTASVCAMPIRPAMSTGETMYVCWIARVSATVPSQSSPPCRPVCLHVVLH